MKNFFIFSDGGARGNPGPAAIGFIIKDQTGKLIGKNSRYIGRTTNNVAEYTAVIEALNWLKENYSISQLANYSIIFFLDSQLIVNQLNGVYRIKNSNLRDIIVKVRQLEMEIKSIISYHFIPREKNKQADFLVNQTLKKLNL